MKTSISSFISKLHVYQLPLLLATYVVFFSMAYYNYVLHINVPLVSHDTLLYGDCILSINKGLLPIDNLAIDVPMGYPKIMQLLYAWGGNVHTIVYFQLGCFLVSSCFLLFRLFNFSRKAAFIFLPLIAFFSMTPEIMKINTALFPDSIYCSILLIISGLLIKRTEKTNYFYFSLLFGLVICAGLVRSNGFYLYFIPLYFILSALRKKSKTWIHLSLIWMFVCILGASFNVYYKGYFFPADVKRILVKFNPENDLEHTSLKESNSVKEKTIHYLFHTSLEEASFYYSMLPARIAWDQHFLTDAELAGHKRRFSQDEILAYVTNGYSTNHINSKIQNNYLNYTYPQQNKVNYFLQIAYKIGHIMFYKSCLILLTFWFIAIYLIVKGIVRRSMNNQWLKIMLLFIAIHLLSIVLLIFGHPIYVTRYATVTEFIPFLTIALFLSKINFKSLIFGRVGLNKMLLSN